MRKLCKGMLLLFCALSVPFLVRGTRAEAAGNATMLPDTSIQVNYENEEMIIAGGKNSVIYYSDNANSSFWEEAKVGADGNAVFDISWVKPGTTTRIYLKGDVDTIVTARYVKAQEKLSADFVGDISAADVVDIDLWKDVYKKYPNFNAETGYILFFTKQGGAQTAFFDVEQIEWKKELTGNWRPFEELNLSHMNAKGVTLYFRIKAVNDEDTEDGASGLRYSSEAKIILQKIAAAPTVNVNNASMSLSIRNGMEYSLNKKDWNLVPMYDKSATEDTISVPVVSFDVLPTTNRRVTSLAIPLVLGVNANTTIDDSLVKDNPDKYRYEVNEEKKITGIYVYVRSAASGRKAASKVNAVLVPFSGSEPNVAADITVEYQNTKSGTGGVMITNNTKGENATVYQFTIVDNPDRLTPEELSELRWSTLKAAKTLKVSSSRALPGQYLIFRKASEAKAELPSNFEKYPYPVQYDKVTYAGISTTSMYPGGVISAVTSNNAIAGEITYTWQRCQTSTGTFETITSGEGYEASKYTIRDSDVGYYIRVVISNTSITGEKASVISRNSGKIAKDPTASRPTPSPAPEKP